MNRQPNDDLFEESRMSFGEHLEELRTILFRCVIGLAVGMVVGIYFTKDVVSFLRWPVEEAITDFRVNVARKKIIEQYGFVPPEKEFLLAHQQKTPTSVLVNPADLYLLLQEYRPSEFTAKADPLDLSGRNIPLVAVPAVAKSLSSGTVNQSGSTKKKDADRYTKPAKHLSSLLTEEERQKILKIGNKDPEKIQPQDQVVLLKALNRLSGALKWYDHSTLEEAYTAAQPHWLVKSWNDFWQIGGNDPDNALGKLKKSLTEKPDPKLQKRLQRALLEKMFLVADKGSEFRAVEFWMPVKASTQSLGTSEAFMIYLKAVVLVGLVVAGPYLFFQIWTFVAAGLYPSEKKYVYIYLPFSLFLFFSGVSVAFLFAFKPVLSFLFSFNEQLGIDPQPQIGQWLSFVMFLPLGFGVAFQLPIVMMLLYRIGIISLQTYVSQWRMAILIIAVLSMVLTPADPISMVLLGGPLTLLYGLGVFLCWMFPRQTAPAVVQESRT